MVSENKKVGLFGGSFNPIHKNHLKVVDAVLKDKIVDEVWIVPCGNHAFGKKLIDFKVREKMIKLALGKRKKVRISRIESELKDKSYTLKTLEKVQKENPKIKFSLIIGSDIVEDLHKWYNYKEVLRKTSFIVLERPGYFGKKLIGMKIEKVLRNKTSCDSSTMVRELLSLNKSVKNFVTKEVRDYILNRGLYT